MAKRKRNKVAENIRNERRKMMRRIDRLKSESAPESLVQSLENIVKSSYIRTNKKRGITGTSVSGAIANLAEGLRLEARYEIGESFKTLQDDLVRSEWLRGAKGETSTYKQGAIDLFYASMVNVGRTDAEIINYLEGLANKDLEKGAEGVTFSNVGKAYDFWLTQLSEYAGPDFNIDKFLDDMETMSRNPFYEEYALLITKIFNRD